MRTGAVTVTATRTGFKTYTTQTEQTKLFRNFHARHKFRMEGNRNVMFCSAH